MKKLFGILLIAAMTLCLSGCKQGAKLSDSQKLADKAMAALVKGDYDAYAATFAMSENDQKMLAGMIEEKAGSKFAAKGGIDSYTIGDEELNEDGDEAEVNVTIKYKDGTEENQTLSFKKEDDKWKQVIDK